MQKEPRRIRLGWPSPAMVVATIALIVACAGSATAASLITSANIKNRSIALVDIKQSAIDSLRGKTGPRGPAGAVGATGAAGPQGPVGPVGPVGPQGPAAPTPTGSATITGLSTTGGQPGTVTSSAGGLNCVNTPPGAPSGTCSATIPAGIPVTLTATGGNFITFSGAPCSAVTGGSSPRSCTFTATPGANYTTLNVDFS
ncbi:hypothetical protein DSM112329_04363 [Paraconexibacter sp. AEG42_29]|uniref:Collagen-like protein n=1 Tax=Paraconexibacter sp. AEG42_29 TaxID=2997339 RepID=A0AAU7B0G5_9ACTN